MEKQYNPEIADAVRRFLDADDWCYRFDSERGFFHFGVNLKGRMKNIQLVVCVNEHDYTVYALSPLSADLENPDQMCRMAEFVCRANYGLRNGNFELDFNDGELRYKCFVNCKDSIPGENVIGESIHCPAVMFDRYSRGIIQILFNGILAEYAIALCEEEEETSSPEQEDSEEESSAPLINLLRRLQDNQEEAEDDLPAD